MEWPTVVTISIPDVLAGNKSAFVLLHTVGMLSLVVRKSAITVDTAPETLLFDVARLDFMQKEYIGIVSTATGLIIAKHAILGREKRLSPEKIQFLKDLEPLLSDCSDFCKTSSQIRQNLDSSNLLDNPEERGKFLRELEAGLDHQTNAVWRLM